MADANDLLWSPVVDNQVSIEEAKNKPRTPSSNMDKDAFLRLLITQMQYQDPLNPMDDQAFLGQMAQFTALEQMQNLNKAYAQSQAYGMIGKSVYAEYTDPKTNNYVEATGEVMAVTMKNGEVYLLVGENEVPLSSVSIVGDDTFSTNELNNSLANAANQGYVGKYIQALIQDKKGNVTDYVEGVVDYIKQNGGQSVLVVGNKEVFPSEVASVSDQPLLLGKTVNAEIRGKDGSRSTIQGPISNITIDGDSANLVIGGNTVPIDKINYVMEALGYVGQSVEYQSIKGVVDSVTVKYGKTYMDVGGQSIVYSDYLESIKQ